MFKLKKDGKSLCDICKKDCKEDKELITCLCSSFEEADIETV